MNYKMTSKFFKLNIGHNVITALKVMFQIDRAFGIKGEAVIF